jgi:hypothetical protein
MMAQQHSNSALTATETLIARLFDFVSEINRELEGRLDNASQASGLLTPDAIKGLASVLQGRLPLEGTLVAGAGAALAPEVLSGIPRYMEWWTSPIDDSASKPLVVSFDPRSLNYYDYIEAEWYLRAQANRGPTVVGPYVDALGTDENVITLSVPSFHNQSFAGVCSVDLRAGVLEGRVTRALRELGESAALVNGEGRVIASTSVDRLPGSLVGGGHRHGASGELTGWSLVEFE